MSLQTFSFNAVSDLFHVQYFHCYVLSRYVSTWWYFTNPLVYEIYEILKEYGHMRYIRYSRSVWPLSPACWSSWPCKDLKPGILSPSATFYPVHHIGSHFHSSSNSVALYAVFYGWSSKRELNIFLYKNFAIHSIAWYRKSTVIVMITTIMCHQVDSNLWRQSHGFLCLNDWDIF